MHRTIAVYVIAYLATFVLRALAGSAEAFAIGLLVTTALAFQMSRSILLRIKKKDDAGRYSDRIMTGTTLYTVVIMVALPICLFVIVGYLIIYTFTL